ncbi:MAG: site-2 protease family protein [Anaerolineae bacterium]
MENIDATWDTEQASLENLKQALQGLMEIDAVRVLSADSKPAVEFTGRLRDGEETFDDILERFEKVGYTPQLRNANGTRILRAIPTVLKKERQGNPWVNLGLFLATLLSVLFIGAMNEGGQPLQNFNDIWLGLPFAGTLLGILTAHELSHYFVGRRYGSPVSLPYFIPLPLSILGTMGAVIVQKGPMRSRKALFDIGVAGPLGGLVLAIPLLVVGLFLSEVQPLPINEPYFMEGNSLLYFLVKWAIFGQPLPSGGVDVMLHPMAFAAWAGLMVTALNLFPVGQLDGGHVTYAMWGRKAWTIARIFVALFFGWGAFLLLSGNQAGWTWIVWGGLGTLMGARHPAPLNDAKPLGRTRKILGWGVVALFFLLVVPIPLVIVTP